MSENQKDGGHTFYVKVLIVCENQSLFDNVWHSRKSLRFQKFSIKD